MTNQIIELAKQAGLLPNHEVYEEDLQRFYELVRNEVLEEAAKVCEKLANDKKVTQPQQFALDLASDAIRSMKK